MVIKIKKLIKELNSASKLYYNGFQSNLSDKEWDNKFDELKILERETNIIYANSPTQKVGYEVLDNLEKVTHLKPMLSLNKTKEVNELKNFLGNEDGILSWKEDGLTIVLTYKNGKLVDAVTRGNGAVGSKILHNAKVFKNIPQTIDYKGNLIIRGEGLISKEDFNIINANGEYANPRNLASGSIMQLDNKITKQRHLQFKAFGIIQSDIKFELYSEQLMWLQKQGFESVEFKYVTKSNLEENINSFKNSINEYIFATDGLVLMFDDFKYGDSLGFTSHHYNNAIAFKWNDTVVETQLINVEYQVSRTGLINPVAVFKEVEIEGSMVERATLHNISFMKSLELGMGDTIGVYKSNMVIPKINDNYTRSNTLEIPKICPCCGHPTSIKQTDNAEFLICSNENCSAKLVQKISHYTSRDALNIDGLSVATIEKFINKGFLSNVLDIYKLEQYKSDIVKMDGFGLKSYNKLIEAINKSKQCKLENFIYGLGIDGVGKSTAKNLVEFSKYKNQFTSSITSIAKISQYKINDLLNMKDTGDITANNIYNWFNNQDNINMLDELLGYIEFIDEENKVVNSSIRLDNVTFVVTGEVNKFKNRKELQEKIELLGGKVSGSVSKNTNYLINNDTESSSGKNKKAKELNVKIINEDNFLNMIGEI